MSKATSASYYTTGAGTSGGFESYYLDAVTDGEPPGFWSGRLAAAVGLEGEVEAHVMERVYGRFEHPQTGEPLGLRPQKWRSVEERLADALADEPDALPERVEQLRAYFEEKTRTTVMGWDATFNVPKSVTVAHTALYRAEIAATRSGNTDRAAELGTVRRGIETAILDANAAAVSFLQELAVARTGGGSGTAQQWIRADSVLVASFPQQTSRSVDPHLHVHNVVLNRALCADGKIRALDGDDLLSQKYAFSAVADRALFEGLAGIGLDSVPRADGLGRELAAVPAEAVEHFSTRRARITQTLAPLVEAAEQAKGRPLTDWETYQLKQTVTLATRAAKDHTGWTREELLQRWDLSLVTEAGRTLDGLADAVMADVARGPVTGTALEDWSPSAVIAEAVAACAERSATWGRANLISELELRLPVLGIATDQVVPFLERLADAALDSEHVVPVTGYTPDLDTGTTRLAAAAPSARRYAATGTLAAELALREAALTRSGTALDPAAVAAWLDTHTPTIGDDQRAAVLGLATTDAAVSVLVGPAGTGKSYTAGALAGAWATLTTPQASTAPGPDGGPAGLVGEPGRVVGLAVSQIATTVLLDDGLPHAANVAAFLAAQQRLDDAGAKPGGALAGDAVWRLRPNDIVLVDEASMVATADLDQIRRRVEAAGARMVLAGDPRQLAAVQAGGALDVLDGHANTYTLSEVRRFDADWERAASLALRDAGITPAEHQAGTAGTTAGATAGTVPVSAADALAVYDRHGRLLEHPTLEDALDAAARAAVADRLDGRTTVVVTGTNDQAARTAMKIRDTLVTLGHVDADGVHLGRDGCTAGVGDVIACRRNDYTLGVTNRQQYTVNAVHDDGSMTVAPLPAGPGHPGTVPAGTLIDLPAGYVADDVQLGYASTVHAAQGITVDTAHLATDGGLDPAGIYVALTRGRTRNTAHVAVTVDPTDPAGRGTSTLAGDGGPLPEVATDRGGATVLGATSTRASARAVLAAAWNRTDHAGSAVVAAETDAARRSSAAAILSDIETHTRLACRTRMETHLDDLVAAGMLDTDTRARLATDQASEHLSRLLRAVEQTGEDPRTALTDALTASTGTGTDAGAAGRGQAAGRDARRGRASRAARAATARTPGGPDAVDAPSAVTVDRVKAAFADAHSVAQVLSHRITATHLTGIAGIPALDDTAEAADPATAGHRSGILLWLPAEIDPDAAALLTTLHAAFEDRARQLGAQLADNPPAWALLSLGPVPGTVPGTTTTTSSADVDEPPAGQDAAHVAARDVLVDPAVDRADWERRAGLAAAHREAVGWTHPEQALPAMPGVSAPERRATYTAAWTALGLPAAALDETSMSDGRLRARVTAWERQQQWAPPHADAALKDASVAAERARQDAVLADAEGRTAEAATLRAEADRQTALAATYDQVSRARAQWAVQTLTTRTNAERAREELVRRGITLGDEPDRAPTAEHLEQNTRGTGDQLLEVDSGRPARAHHDDVHRDAAEVDATVEVADVAAEDEHRAITDADVRDITTEDDAWAQAVSANHAHANTATAGDGASLDDLPVLDLDADRTRRPHRAGRRPSHQVVTAGPDMATVEALVSTAEAAARVAADQASQDDAYADHATLDTDAQIAASGRGRHAALRGSGTTDTHDDVRYDSDADTWHHTADQLDDGHGSSGADHGNSRDYDDGLELGRGGYTAGPDAGYADGAGR